MNPLTATDIGIAPSGWYVQKKLKISFNYFNRFATNAAVLLLGDLVGITLAFELAGFARWAIFGSSMNPVWLGWLCLFWVGGATAWGLLPGWGLSAVESLRREVCLTFVVFAAVLVTLFFGQSAHENSRFMVISGLLFAVPLIPLIRALAKRCLMKEKLWGIPVAIYGGGVAGRSIIQRLKEKPELGYYPICVFDDDEALQSQTVEGVQVCGTTDTIAQNVPVAIIAMTKISGERISELMEDSLASYLRVIIIPNLIHTPSLWATTRDLSGIPALQMENNLLDPGKCILKRSFEIAVTCLTLPIWGPVYMSIYALIWLEDRKAPIFKQKRMGVGRQPFDTWKFRTMVPDAEAVLEKNLSEDPDMRTEWNENCKLKVDPRITKVGRLLRKFSLDEIPQLVNVLRGEMSLIGPRPLPDYHYDQLPASVQKLRERVRPGMTGLWQVSGRSDSGNEGMVRWDPYYVRNWSIWLDILILVRTIRVVILGSGAH